MAEVDLTKIYGLGFKTNNKVEYALHISYQYVINKIEGRQVSITIADNTIHNDTATPVEYHWLVKKGTNIIYEGFGSVIKFTFELCRELDVEYEITTKYGVSILDRTLYFNTYPTINSLLARTSTAISKAYNGNNYKLLMMDADEYDMIYASMRELMKSGYIKWATGVSLDYLAVLWKIYRKDGETDEEFRSRIVQTITAENVQVSKQGLLALICASYGLTTDGVELVEREELPDYTWGKTIGGNDMLPYDNSYRPAEFTYFLLDGPTIPTDVDYITEMINKARACGVYFNNPKVTIVADTENIPITIGIEEFALYDTIVIEGEGGWGDMSWGTKGEEIMPNIINPIHMYNEVGNWVIIAATYGDTIGNNGYKEKTFEVKYGTQPWGTLGWGEFNWDGT